MNASRGCELRVQGSGLQCGARRHGEAPIKLNLFRFAQGYLVSPAIMWLPIEAEHAHGPVEPLGVFDSSVLPTDERHRVTRAVFRQQFAVLPREVGNRLHTEPVDMARA